MDIVNFPELHLNISKVYILPVCLDQLPTFYAHILWHSSDGFCSRETSLLLFLQYFPNFIFSSVCSISIYDAKTVNFFLPWVKPHYASIRPWPMSSFYVKELLVFHLDEYILPFQIFQRGI